MRHLHFRPVVLGALLLGGLAWSPRLRAGDKEWERFGKAMAVVIGLDLLRQAVWVPPSPVCHEYREVYREAPAVRTVVIRQPTARRRADPDRSYVNPDSGSLTGSRPSRSYTGVEPGKRTDTEDAIVFDLENGRRLYQPRVKGAKAQIQVYSEIEDRWVPVKEYPSLY